MADKMHQIKEGDLFNAEMGKLAKKALELLLEFKLNPLSLDIVEKITIELRVFRGLCTMQPNNLDYQTGFITYENGIIVKNIVELLTLIEAIRKQNEKTKLCLRVGLEYLGNLLVQNKANQEYFIKNYSKFLRDLFCPTHDQEVKTAFYFIYYNILFGSPELQNYIMEHREFLTDIFKSLTKGNEYAGFFFDLFLLRGILFNKWYYVLSSHQRLDLLETIHATLRENPKDISVDLILNIAKTFQNVNHVDILQSYNYSTSSTAAWESIKFLDILGTASSIVNILEKLQETNELFAYCVWLLNDVHYRGFLDGNSVFARLRHLDSGSRMVFGVEEHPAFGFKVNLIKLIANLSYESRPLDIQFMRRSRLMEILAECCGHDARNMLIQEWVIFAMRNLCKSSEHNFEMFKRIKKNSEIDAKVNVNTDPLSSKGRFMDDIRL